MGNRTHKWLLRQLILIGLHQTLCWDVPNVVVPLKDVAFAETRASKESGGHARTIDAICVDTPGHRMNTTKYCGIKKTELVVLIAKLHLGLGNGVGVCKDLTLEAQCRGLQRPDFPI